MEIRVKPCKSTTQSSKANTGISFGVQEDKVYLYEGHDEAQMISIL
jgi:hypothetical protein